MHTYTHTYIYKYIYIYIYIYIDIHIYIYIYISVCRLQYATICHSVATCFYKQVAFQKEPPRNAQKAAPISTEDVEPLDPEHGFKASWCNVEAGLGFEVCGLQLLRVKPAAAIRAKLCGHYLDTIAIATVTFTRHQVCLV